MAGLVVVVYDGRALVIAVVVLRLLDGGYWDVKFLFCGCLVDFYKVLC